jgi:uncharacterized damage-inducible protein DinB
MKQMALLIAFCMLLLTGSTAAQSTKAAGDPLSGTWTGHMGRSATERQHITLALKLDGKSVTGTITGPPNPGEIRRGTFDRSTGALKLEVVVQDEAKTIAIFEGKVAGGSATGRVTLNNETGNFTVTKDAGAAAASPGGNEAVLAALRRSFAEVSGNVTKAADLVPPDKYSYRPAPTVRTYGQQIAHIADGYTYYCAMASGRKVQWTDAIEKGSTDKAAIVAKLKEATNACTAAHNATAQVDQLIGNIGHSNLHYGNLVTYIRMLGLVPPSS